MNRLSLGAVVGVRLTDAAHRIYKESHAENDWKYEPLEVDKDGLVWMSILKLARCFPRHLGGEARREVFSDMDVRVRDVDLREGELPEIERCPSCSSYDCHVNNSDPYDVSCDEVQVGCDQCGSCGRSCDYPYDAIIAWNKLSWKAHSGWRDD